MIMGNLPNIGWLYYKDLYNDQREETVEVKKGLYEKALFSFNFLAKETAKERKPSEKIDLVLKKRSQVIFNEKLETQKPNQYLECSKMHTTCIELTTTYPGLLCGSGYNHGISSVSDFKIGFYFDHTTGLPVIPGSSVKGVLRSAFPGYASKQDYNGLSQEQIDKKKEEIANKYKFFRWIVEQANENIKSPSEKIPEFNVESIDLLESLIFDGIGRAGKQIPYNNRDIFFDAYPFSSYGHEGRFLKNDYITPHINREKPEMSPFSNPNPIQFLKVLPKVQFRFQFRLVNNELLTIEQKRLLFKEILCINGVGAKTNVGYGQFEEGYK